MAPGIFRTPHVGSRFNTGDCIEAEVFPCCLNGICVLPGHPFVDCRGGSHSSDSRLTTCDLRPWESCLAVSTASFPRSSQHPSRAPTSLVPDTALLLRISTSPVTQFPRPKGPCGEGARSPLIPRCLFLEYLLSLCSHACSNDRFR